MLLFSLLTGTKDEMALGRNTFNWLNQWLCHFLHFQQQKSELALLTNVQKKNVYELFFPHASIIWIIFFKLHWLYGMFQKQPLDMFRKEVVLKQCTKL